MKKIQKHINRFYIRYIKYWYIRFLMDRLFTKIWESYSIDSYDYLKNLHRCTIYFLATNSIDFTLYKVMGWWGVDMLTTEEKYKSGLK